jgi:hypothetical protein
MEKLVSPFLKITESALASEKVVMDLKDAQPENKLLTQPTLSGEVVLSNKVTTAYSAGVHLLFMELIQDLQKVNALKSMEQIHALQSKYL